MKTLVYLFALIMPGLLFAQKKGGDCGCTKNSSKSNGYYAGMQTFGNVGLYFNPQNDLNKILISAGAGLQAGININESSSLQLGASLYKTKNIPGSQNLMLSNTFTKIDINYSDVSIEWVKRIFLTKSKKMIPYFTLGINNHLSNIRIYQFIENDNGYENANKTDRGFLYYSPAFTFSGGINNLLSRETSLFTGLRLSNNLPATFTGKYIEGAFDRQIMLQAGINFHF